MKPGDFFVGIIDFFAILLPGAMLCFLGLPFAHDHLFGHVLPEVAAGAQSWVAFVLASYLLGQFTFLLGATFMDHIYDATYLAHKRKGGDRLYQRAREIQGDDQFLNGSFKWASAFVRLRSAEAALGMDHFEATSKFFRSLVIVLFVYSALFVTQGKWWYALCVCVLMLLSFWRFVEQRWKLTQLCYMYFIQLNGSSPPASAQGGPAAPHARSD